MGGRYTAVIDGARTTEPIGGDGLTGAIAGSFVVLKGPCGQSHTLSFVNARHLRDWLDRQPEITGRPVITLEPIDG